jgi:uncharacterized protein YndB with AHSA1/START domain
MMGQAGVQSGKSDAVPLEMLTTVLFAAQGDGTQVTLHFEPLDATPEEEAFLASMTGSMQGGWSGSFDQLEGFLAAG